MAILRIKITNPLQNPSIQIGDIAYYQNITNISSSSNMTTADNPVFIGNITSIGQDFIEVSTVLTSSDISGFLMFAKDKKANNNSLKGYFAQVKLRNNDNINRSELFALNSEVVTSSK